MVTTFTYKPIEFAEDRFMQFRVIVVTVSHTNKHKNTNTNKQTHRQDRLQYTAPQLSSAQCNE